MDYSHSPFLIYLIGGLGALLGVVFVAGTLLVMRRPRRPGGDADRRGPGGPPTGP